MTEKRLVRRGALVLTVAALAGGGCNRQDAEALARIGHLLVQRAQALKQKTGGNTGLARALPEFGVAGEGGELERKVDERLKSEPGLTSLSIQVRAEGGRVRLSGRVRDDDEWRRVVTAAEAAAGAGNVIDELEQGK
jgi:hypothetical protein